MKTSRWLLAGAITLAAGCTDMGRMCQSYAEFFGPIEDYETNAGGKPIGLAVHVSCGGVSEEKVTSALAKVSLVDGQGTAVPSRVEVHVPAADDAGAVPDWCRHGQSEFGLFCASIAPDAPLADGWYTVASIEFDLDRKPTSSPATHFYIGSRPILQSAALSTKGGLTGEMRFSEELVLTGMGSLISVQPVGKPQECCALEANYKVVGIVCDFSIDEEIELVVKPGLVSPTGVPLQDLQGNTEFTIRLGPKTGDSGGAVRRWQAGSL